MSKKQRVERIFRERSETLHKTLYYIYDLYNMDDF